MNRMKRPPSTLQRLLHDERSAAQFKVAALASFVVLTFAATGLLLMSFGERLYQSQAERILTAQHDEPASRLPV